MEDVTQFAKTDPRVMEVSVLDLRVDHAGVSDHAVAGQALSIPIKRGSINSLIK